ncbi:MAG TPA: hypothetical protein VIL56_06370 [Gaiellaceae bacterium]|jgi:hypothetical protein
MTMALHTNGALTAKRGLLAVAAALVLLVAAGSAGATGTYLDAGGDSGSAPDITQVSVASDATGTLVFRISAKLTQGAEVTTLLLLDTDLNPATGAPGTLDADYVFEISELDNTYDFGRWNGSDWDDSIPYATVQVSTGPAGATITMNRSELGDASGFNFWARTIDGSYGPGKYDDAPDDGAWNYMLAAGGPDIQSVLVTTVPAAGPKVGKQFTLTPVGLRLPPNGATISILPIPDSYTCRAVLRGVALQGTGTGGCTWRIPKKARGRSLAVTLTASYQGATKPARFVYRVA